MKARPLRQWIAVTITTPTSDTPTPSADEPPIADWAFGTFSSNPPWLVDPEAMVWANGLEEVREKTRRSVPRLVRSPKLPPLGRLAVTGRYLGLGVAIWYLGARRKGGSE